MKDQKTIGAGLIALGAGIAGSAALGPLVLKVIEFRTSASIENQFIGGEIVSLGVVAPVAIAAGLLWLRGHRLAPALALAPSLYATYTYTSVVLGQEYGRYPGNVEKFFPLYAGLVAGSAALAATAWAAFGQQELPGVPDRLRRILAGIFLAGGGLIALAWAQQIRLVLTGRPMIEYQEGPALFWTIKLLDFGFVIPACIATGAGLLRQRRGAVRAAYGLAGFLTCLAGSVTGMAAAMMVMHDPAAQPAMLVVLVPVTAGLAAVTLALFRSSTPKPTHRTIAQKPATPRALRADRKMP